MEDFERYRSEFPITERFAFMNHAAVSPLPVRAVKAVEDLFQEFSCSGIECYPNWERRIHEVRKMFARLINADANEIAFVGSTSEGLSAVATGLEWKKGDIVLIPEIDFPANIYPWMNLERHGVTTRFIPKKDGRFEVRDVEKVLSPRTRLVSVSSVDFATGFRYDLEALGDFCREKGLLFCVDAIQSLGVIPLDVKKYGIHFLSAGGHKWLLSTMGCGCLYIARAVNHIIHPERVGWKSVVDEEDFFRVHFHLKPNALRFEPGTMNVAGIYCLGAAIELILEVGIPSIHQHILAINDILFRGLRDRSIKIVTSMEEKERSGILSFVPPSDSAGLWKYLSDNRIMVSLRDGKIRLSPHFYNNNEDAELFLRTLVGFYGSKQN